MAEIIQARRTTATFALLLVAVAIAAWFSFSSARSYLEDSAWEKHSDQVLEEITSLTASLRTAESGVRGFVITGEEEYISDFGKTESDLRVAVDHLESLTRDNPKEQGRVKDLRTLVEQRIGILQNGIQRRRTVGIEVIVNTKPSNRGEAVTGEITGLLDQMKAQEQAILDDRRRRSDRAAHQAEAITALLAALIAIVLSAGFLRLRRDSADRVLAQRRLAAQYKFATILAEAEDLKDAIAPILKIGCEALEGSVSELWLLDRQSGGLRLVDLHGPIPLSEARRRELWIKPGMGLPGRVWATERPVWLCDVQQDREVLDYCASPSADLHAAAGFPILSESAVIGVLAFYATQVREFDPDSLDMVTGFSGQLGQYIERKRTEQQLTEERIFQRMTLSSIGDGVITTDTKGRITFMNSVAERLTCWRVDDAKGLDFAEVVTFESEQESVLVANPVKFVLDSGAGYDTEEKTLLVTRDGTRLPVADSAAPILTENGDVIGVVLVIRDVSSRRELDRLKDEFVSVVSHELRTPLTSIRGSLGLLEGGVAGELPVKAQRMLGIAVTNTDRLVRLINDILDIERMESGKVTIEKSEQNLADLMEQAVDLMQGMASQSRVQLLCEVLDVPVMIDHDRMLQIVTNLLSNAIKFSAPGRAVTLSAEVQAERVVLKVADQGRGIPADRLESIFGRFQQVDTSDSREKGGTGLGLAISRTLARQHGGDIWVESELGRGSTFYLSLPLLKVEAAISR